MEFLCFWRETVHDRIAAGETTVVSNGCCTAMWKANGKTTVWVVATIKISYLLGIEPRS
jgi:hypothetical protein